MGMQYIEYRQHIFRNRHKGFSNPYPTESLALTTRESERFGDGLGSESISRAATASVLCRWEGP